MPSATDATGRLNRIMRSVGVCRQRRAPTSERASHARLPLGFSSGDRGALARHAAEGQQDARRRSRT